MNLKEEYGKNNCDGCTGSGKSSFCKKQNKIANLLLIHLDVLPWNENMTRLSDS